MDRYDVKDAVRDELAGIFKEKECPECKASTTFIKVDWCDENRCYEYWRCLKCLTLFEEEMKEVK